MSTKHFSAPSPICVRTFSTWQDWKTDGVRQLFSDGFFKRNRFIFRGHGNESYPLNTSFDRWFESLGRASKERTTIASRLLKEFRNACEHLEGFEEIWRSEPHSWALGQHYGLPTRMLDWTQSPYIAAFFAFESALQRGLSTHDVAIWVLNREHSIWGQDNGVQVIDLNHKGNQRIHHQSGCFTLSQTPIPNLEEFVETYASGADGVALYKWIISSSEARAALADLDAMGINHAHVYPELTGLATSAKIRVVLGLDT